MLNVTAPRGSITREGPYAFNPTFLAAGRREESCAVEERAEGFPRIPRRSRG